MEWDSNPRLLRDWCLKPAPWTARPSNLVFTTIAYGTPKSRDGQGRKKQKATASIGTRTRILTLEGLNTTLVLWTQNEIPRIAPQRQQHGTALGRGACCALASIAQLAEHALSKRKVTSSILVGGFQCSYGLAWS